MVSFRPLEAVQKLRDAGVDDPQATATVEVVDDATSAATSDLVTRDYFDARLHSELQAFRADMGARFAALDVRFAEQRAEMYRANWLLGGGIVAMLSMIIGTLVAVVQVLD